MEGEGAEPPDAGILLPESAVKPGLKVRVSVFSVFGKGRKFRGRAVLGIREVSRSLEFESSYTLIEHAPDDSIQLEILPEALKQVRKLSDSVGEGQYNELRELLGLNGVERREDDEVRTVEALLHADTSGYIVRFPWMNNQLNKLLAHWAYKTCTGGGFHLPAFALADDGYLIAFNGRLYARSHWIPPSPAIAPIDSKRGLCVRYPIRMFEDLLPVEHIGSSELMMRLTRNLDEQGCNYSYQLAEKISTNQLFLEGTYVLHSETAKPKRVGFYFVLVAVLDEDRFPRFVRSRFGLAHEFQQPKTNNRKARGPSWNLEPLPLNAPR